MKNCNRTFWLGLFLLMSSGCNPLGSEKFKVEFKNSGAFKDLKTQVVNVSIANNQLVISGSSLSGIKTATLKNVSQEEVFQVESATESQIIANGARAISIAAGSVFDLILADAYGAATFQVTFSVADGAITTTKIANGAVTAAKLDSMGASAGQYLKYNGSSWVAASLIDGQTYLGTWNATTNAPDLTLPSSLAGDYYVVTVAGTFNGIAYAVGDWIISDGYSWQKIPYSKTSVASFQGRKGVVTLVPGDYVSLKDAVTSKVTGSSLNDIADIDLTTIAPISGSVLKYNGSKWVAGTDNTGVASGSIVDADVSATANIAQSKISGLTGSLSGKQDTSTLASDVRAIPLTGLTSASGSVAATDTILGAFGKLMNTQSDYVSKSTGAAITTGTIAVSGTGMITIPTATGVTATEAANVTYVNNAISANGVWNKSGSTINYTAGNVGVGTTTPNAPLHVKTSNDGTYGGSLIENLNSAQYAGFSAKNDVGNTIQLGIYGSTNSSANKAFLYAGASTGSLGFFINSAEKMTLLQNGNVGIGTSAPGAKLEISGSAWSDADGGDFRVTNSGTVGSSVTIKSTTTGGHSYSLLSTGTGAIQGAGSFAIFDNTVPAYRLYINGSGNIGIGTTTPATNLEVAGALRLSTTGTDSFTTPAGSSVPTKINIPYFNPGAFGQILIAGLPSVAPSSARAMTFVDARTVAHQPTVAVLSPNENQIMGLSFDGSNT
ncbi:MAG: beta strand repeat-containing protein, partial [Bacteriovorax sp.]